MLTDMDYHETMLPRIPIPVQKDIKQKLGDWDAAHPEARQYDAGAHKVALREDHKLFQPLREGASERGRERDRDRGRDRDRDRRADEDMNRDRRGADDRTGKPPSEGDASAPEKKAEVRLRPPRFVRTSFFGTSTTTLARSLTPHPSRRALTPTPTISHPLSPPT